MSSVVREDPGCGRSRRDAFENRGELFREDATHLKPEAYDPLAAVIAPVVERVYAEVLDERVKDVSSEKGDEDFLPPSMGSRSHA